MDEEERQIQEGRSKARREGRYVSFAWPQTEEEAETVAEELRKRLGLDDGSGDDDSESGARSVG